MISEDIFFAFHGVKKITTAKWDISRILNFKSTTFLKPKFSSLTLVWLSRCACEWNFHWHWLHWNLGSWCIVLICIVCLSFPFDCLPHSSHVNTGRGGRGEQCSALCCFTWCSSSFQRSLNLNGQYLHFLLPWCRSMCLSSLCWYGNTASHASPADIPCLPASRVFTLVVVL